MDVKGWLPLKVCPHSSSPAQKFTIGGLSILYGAAPNSIGGEAFPACVMERRTHLMLVTCALSNGSFVLGLVESCSSAQASPILMQRYSFILSIATFGDTNAVFSAMSRSCVCRWSRPLPMRRRSPWRSSATTSRKRSTKRCPSALRLPPRYADSSDRAIERTSQPNADRTRPHLA